MHFPEYTEITPKTLRDLQLALRLNNKAMAELVGVSEKTWLNRISAGTDKNVKLLSKLEYAYLKSIASSTIAAPNIKTT